MDDFTPKAAKGGVFAPADMKIIKDAMEFFLHTSENMTEAEERQIINLLHRLNRIS